MRATVIHDTTSFRVVSHGNGLAYMFTHKPTDMEVFFQGDDAMYFEGEIDAHEYHHPEWDYERIFRELWNEYGHIAEPH